MEMYCCHSKYFTEVSVGHSLPLRSEVWSSFVCFFSAWLNAYVAAELILDRISGSPQHHRQRERDREREQERGRRKREEGKMRNMGLVWNYWHIYVMLVSRLKVCLPCTAEKNRLKANTPMWLRIQAKYLWNVWSNLVKHNLNWVLEMNWTLNSVVLVLIVE